MKLFFIFLLANILATLAFSRHHRKKSLFPLDFFRFQEKLAPFLRKTSDFPDEFIGNGPIYKKGWLKYILLTSKTANFLQEFAINPAFSDESREILYNSPAISQENREFLRESGEKTCESLQIPSKYHFFFYLTAENLYIVSARRNSLAKTVKTLRLKPENRENSEYISNIEDQGDYFEGFCFKLQGFNCGLSEFLILCAEKREEKDDWLKKIRILQRRCQGDVSLVNEVMIQAKIKENNEFLSNYKVSINNSSVNTDGKWIILHDWSTCTVACGGGTQTLHRLCIPPTNAGKPCEGQAIINKTCNLQPCPSVRVVVDERVAPTKIKMLRISRRPQRYETCVVKEGDLEILKNSLKQSQRSPRIPARVVLNNKTLAVFESDDYSTVIFSLNLQNLKTIENSREDPENCFVLRDCETAKSLTLCGFSNNGRLRPSLQKKEWVKDIYFFRDRCKEDLPHEFDEVFLMKKRALEAEDLERRALGRRNQEKREKLQRKLEKLQYLAMIAAAKENKYEKMAEREEIEREEKEENELRKRYELEKIKGELYETHQHLSRKTRANDDEAQEIDEMNEELRNTQESLKEMLRLKHEQSQKKLDSLKTRSQRKRQELLDKISGLKEQYATSEDNCNEKLKENERKNVCFVNEKAKDFCDEHFKGSQKIEENLNCKEEDNFCFVCCEVLLFDDEQRENCEKQCDQALLRKKQENSNVLTNKKK